MGFDTIEINLVLTKNCWDHKILEQKILTNIFTKNFVNYYYFLTLNNFERKKLLKYS